MMSFLMVDCRPDLRRSFRLYLFVHAKMRHHVRDMLVLPREVSRTPFSHSARTKWQTRRDSTLYEYRPSYLSYDGCGRCCYKRTILSREYAFSWRRMIDQKERETRSSQQITIDTYMCVHARAYAWHASNTCITCYQHCIFYALRIFL